MSTTAFNRADLKLTTTLTQVYGPVASGVVAVVFHGTAANIDDTNKSTHSVTLQIHNGAAVVNRLDSISVPYGSSAKLPKMVLKVGDSVYASTDVNNMIDFSIDILEITG